MLKPPDSALQVPANALPDTSLFSRPDAGGPKTLLVVDDDPAIRRIMAAALQQAGYRVLQAADGDIALELLTRFARERHGLDAMLLDIHMPKAGGMELLERMSHLGMVLPIIAVTGDHERATAIELMRRGVGDLIDKPVQIDLLVTTVRNFLERNDRQAERRRAREKRLKAEMESLDQEKRSNERKAREASDSYYRLEAQVQSARSVWRDLTATLQPPPGVCLAWRSQPLSDLGGDFVGLRTTERGCLLLVADVAGHDMGASLHGVLIKAFFEENCRSGLAGEEFLRRLNRQLIQSTAQRRLVTAQLIDLDLAHKQAVVIGAGHPAVLHQNAQGMEQIPGDGGVLGIREELALAPVVVALDPGDRLFTCTDGVADLPRIDGRSGERTRFGLSGLALALQSGRAKSLDDQVEGAWRAVRDFCRKKPVDDMVLVGLGLDAVTDEYEPTERPGEGSGSGLRPQQE
jgi:DNA-binding response OmpR family regulator